MFRGAVLVRIGVVVRHRRKVDDHAVPRSNVDVGMPDEFGKIDAILIVFGQHDARTTPQVEGLGRTSKG